MRYIADLQGQSLIEALRVTAWRQSGLCARRHLIAHTGSLGINMHVAICIVSFRNAGDVMACLAALASSTFPDFEVVICENGGPKAFARLTEILPATVGSRRPVRAILAPGNLGYAGGVNVCLRATPDAEAWWVLNPDTEPRPEALAALVHRLSQGDCDLVGGTVISTDGLVESRVGRWRPWLARAEAVGSGERLEAPVDVRGLERAAGYISGASMLVSRHFIETTGTMREDYFLYCEEVEWSLRGLQRGMHIGYAPDAHVVHRKGTTTGSVSDLTSRPRLPVYLDERNKLLTTRDCYPARFLVAAVSALALLILRYGKRGAWRQLGYALQGWFAGVLNRRGPPAWLMP